MHTNLKHALLSNIDAKVDRPLVGRYAPSPSGPLHMGNIQTALLAWLQVRLGDGHLHLRIDDLDEARTKPGSAQQIMDDLTWLGLHWDGEPYYQTLHIADYEAAFDGLVNSQKVYACVCSRKEIAKVASAPHEPGLSVKYPGTCRDRMLTDGEVEKLLAWRYVVENSLTSFTDVLAGAQRQNLMEDVGDFILRRKDGVYAYQLATVVDDINLGVTDVVRGADLLDSTPRQIALFNDLNGTVPQFWHTPLKLDENGERMAKRSGANSLLNLRQQGITAKQLIAKLAFDLGLLGENEPLSAKDLLQKLKKA